MGASQDITVVESKPHVDPEYLCRYLLGIADVLTANCRGSTIQGLTRDVVEDLPIPLPPLAEQKRIVGVLNEQMAAVERAKKAVEERVEAAQALREALLESVFVKVGEDGWPEVSLGELARLRMDIVHPKDKPVGVATFVGLQHIESGTGKRVGLEEVEKADLTGRKPVFRKGDIVYGYLRPYLNKVWVSEFDGLCSVDQYVYTVATAKVRPYFLASFMRSRVFLSRAPIDQSPGQLPRIRTQEVASVRTNLPPLTVQESIESLIFHQEKFVDELVQSVLAEQTALNTMPSALLRRAFSGEV